MTTDPPDVIATAETWMESAAIDQLARVAALPGMVRAVGMPDLHPGAGSPVGAAFLSKSLIYPQLVGSDIGCGMGLWDTGVAARKVKLDRLERRLDLDDGAPESGDAHLAAEGASPTGYEDALGTIGGGNHFAELLRVHRVDDEVALAEADANAKNVWLLVHSGSRGLGYAVNRKHTDQWRADAVDAASEAGRAYLEAHDNAVRWARANRSSIADRFLSAMGADGRRLLDITHNSVEKYSDSEDLWLHRKGAAPADVGLAAVPGSRGDPSYVVKPIGDGERNLRSIAHGAGRKWARSEAKGKLGAKADASALRRTRFGSHVICDDKVLLFEEAPQAYKPIGDVIASMVDAGLVRVMAELHPVLTYKTRSR